MRVFVYILIISAIVLTIINIFMRGGKGGKKK